ncbi:cupin domain-containing protein [Aquisediminimonas profunda]|uniref:cupin domain-containing protein n=1 Tax=Aquisediminimonas profunda TaxID=1550733 RepID=UPI001C62A1BC|nr:cupin domain-containing protein [Aquisediminimonas profunda]
MKGFIDDIEAQTEGNHDFRRVLYTGKHIQLVLMTLAPGEEIGEEVHDGHDQFFRLEKGKGVIIIDGTPSKIKAGTGIIVPAGARHNLKNTGKKFLRLYTIYGPPEHRDRVIHTTIADVAEEHFDGKTSE